MKLEFLDDISGSGKFPGAYPNQLMRLYDFDVTQANKLRNAIQEAVIENKKPLNLAALNFIQPVNCVLTLHISQDDKGIVTSNHKAFACNLTLDGYNHLIYMLEPFCKEANGYQWLYELDTPIQFLFSVDGSW